MFIHLTRTLGLHPNGAVSRGTPVDRLRVGRSNHSHLELAIQELHLGVDGTQSLRHVRFISFEG